MMHLQKFIRKVRQQSKWYEPLPDCRGTDLQMDSAIPKLPFFLPIKSTWLWAHFQGDSAELQFFWLRNNCIGRCQSGPLCSHRLHQPLWNSISWYRDVSLWTDSETDMSVYSGAFSPSVQRREQEGKSLVVHSFTIEKPEGFSFTFQFLFPTAVCSTTPPFIELFPSSESTVVAKVQKRAEHQERILRSPVLVKVQRTWATFRATMG